MIQTILRFALMFSDGLRWAKPAIAFQNQRKVEQLGPNIAVELLPFDPKVIERSSFVSKHPTPASEEYR